jgi:hypothetical protein
MSKSCELMVSVIFVESRGQQGMPRVPKRRPFFKQCLGTRGGGKGPESTLELGGERRRVTRNDQPIVVEHLVVVWALNSVIASPVRIFDLQVSEDSGSELEVLLGVQDDFLEPPDQPDVVLEFSGKNMPVVEDLCGGK